MRHGRIEFFVRYWPGSTIWCFPVFVSGVMVVEMVFRNCKCGDMINEFSIVIVCKNEAAVIKHVLDSAQAITDDVIVYDNGSTDGTVAIAQQYKNVQLH